MKPKQISEDEFYKIHKALVDKASTLAREANKAASTFFSGAPYTCAYEDEAIPVSFRQYESGPVESLIHFLPYPCSCREKAKMRSGLPITEQPICLAEVWDEYDDEETKYFITVHPVGKCPWKETW